MNLENNGSFGEPIKSIESNEEDFGSVTELQSLIAKEIQELKNSKAGQAKKIVFLEEKLLDHITRDR